MTAGTLWSQRHFITGLVRRFGVREDVEDVVQDVLVAAVLRWQDFKPAEGTIEGWLTGIARRVVSNWRRRRRRKPVVLMIVPPESEHSLDGFYEARSELRAMPEHMRHPLRLMLDHGCKIGPAADDLGIEDETLGARIAALRRGEEPAPIVRRRKP